MAAPEEAGTAATLGSGASPASLEEEARALLAVAFPDLSIEVVPNTVPAGVPSLRVARDHLVRVATALRDDPRLQLDYCSNVTGVDWLDSTVKVKVKTTDDTGAEKEVEETRKVPGYLEVVYHLYSVARKRGPLVLRTRTGDRGADVEIPSLTSVWRSCELQEREVFDLYGVRFAGHPDLRRLLMWDGFEDFPMRKDYVDPDDFEYEPTPHDEVQARVEARLQGVEGAGT